MLHWQSGPAMAKVVPFTGKTKAGDCSAENAFDRMGTRMRFARNSEIFGEDESADYVYRMVAGAVRLSKLMSDGRRQISAFYLPGDTFGLEAGEVHLFSAEAVTDCEALLVKRSALMAEAARQPGLATQLWNQTLDHLRQAQHHMLLLGRKNAQERIAAFLLELAERLSSVFDVRVPMSRQDIADYLGLTIETVSRTLTQLERDGIISIPAARQIVLRDRAALGEMHGSLAA